MTSLMLSCAFYKPPNVQRLLIAQDTLSVSSPSIAQSTSYTSSLAPNLITQSAHPLRSDWAKAMGDQDRRPSAQGQDPSHVKAILHTVRNSQISLQARNAAFGQYEEALDIPARTQRFIPSDYSPPLAWTPWSSRPRAIIATTNMNTVQALAQNLTTITDEKLNTLTHLGLVGYDSSVQGTAVAELLAGYLYWRGRRTAKFPLWRPAEGSWVREAAKGGKYYWPIVAARIASYWLLAKCFLKPIATAPVLAWNFQVLRREHPEFFPKSQGANNNGFQNGFQRSQPKQSETAAWEQSPSSESQAQSYESSFEHSGRASAKETLSRTRPTESFPTEAPPNPWGQSQSWDTQSSIAEDLDDASPIAPSARAKGPQQRLGSSAWDRVREQNPGGEKSQQDRQGGQPSSSGGDSKW